MYPSPRYPTSPDAAERFVAAMKHGTLIACAPGGHPQVSILPFVKSGEAIELHIVRADPTYAALRADPRVTFFVSDFLAFTPHDFVDPADAGKATLHFRAVAYECDVESVSEEPAAVRGALERLLAHHEPGHSYPPLADDDPRFRILAALRLRVVKTHAKFKVGPAAATEVKERVAGLLRDRGEPGDERAADVIEASLRRS
jgi:transcriptional regulator